MATLLDHLALAKNGKGQLVLLSGEAGMGKSRMVKETINHARQTGFTILTGHCYETEQSFPYAPLIEALGFFFDVHSAGPFPEEILLAARQFARHIPELTNPQVDPASALDPEQNKQRLFYHLSHFIRLLSAHKPLLFVIEDLHWCDESTLEFLLHLLQQSDAQTCMLLLSYRPEEPLPGLTHFLAEIDRRRMTTEITLPALTIAEVEALIQAIFASEHPIRAAFLQLLFDLTEGNPFFIEETLKLLIASGEIFSDGVAWDRKTIQELHVPRSVQDAVQQRFDRLSPPARQMLAICSVAGERFDIALLRQVTQAEDAVADRALIQCIKEAINAQLILDVGDGNFVFRHALTRQAIYHGLLSFERQRLHQVIAASLEERFSTHPEGSTVGTLMADLAYHTFQAGEWEKALTYAHKAATLALRLLAPRDAARFYTLAIDASAKLDSQPRLEWLRTRGHCYEILGDFSAADEDYQKAFTAAHQAQDLAAEWQSLIDLGFLWAAKDYTRAGEFFNRAFALAQRSGDPMRLAYSLNRLGNWRLNTGDIRLAAREHQEALEIFLSQNDSAGAAETHDLLGLTYAMGGDMRRAADHLTNARVLFQQLDDKRGLFSSLVSLNTDLFHSDTVYCPPRPFAECQGEAAQALELAIQLDWTAGQAQAEWTTGGMLASFGEFGQALAHTRKGLETAARIDHRQWIAASYATQGEIEVRLLQFRQAIATLESGLTLAKDLGSEYWSNHMTVTLALAQLIAKDGQAALKTLQAQDPSLPEWETHAIHTLGERDILWAWGETLLFFGRSAEALAVANRLLALAYGSFDLSEERTDLEPAVPALLKLKGEALTALNRLEEARQALERAMSAAIERPARPVLWQIQRSLGYCFLQLKQWQLAEDQFAAARTQIQALAHTIDDAGLRAAFLQAALESIPPEKAHPTGRKGLEPYSGLTTRQRQVAALVAQGKSNREIAGALVLSERTVENHIARIFGRLGFDSRAQIAAWVVKSGLDGIEPPEN